MFKRILVPVDFSEKCSRSLNCALDIAGHYAGEVHLLHVIETLADAEFSELQNFYEKMERKALKSMDELMASCTKGSAVMTVHVTFGNRTREILRYAEQNEVGLIIMNSHVVDLEQPVYGWGTISYKVALLSKCPVMLVK